jgi:hypothetical protein
MNPYWNEYDQEFAEEILSKAKVKASYRGARKSSKRTPEGLPDKEGKMLNVGNTVYAVYRPASLRQSNGQVKVLRKKAGTLEKGLIVQLYDHKVDIFFEHTGETVRMFADAVVRVSAKRQKITLPNGANKKWIK